MVPSTWSCAAGSCTAARGEVEGGRARVGGGVALAGEQLSTIHVHRCRNNYMQCKKQWGDYTEKASPFSAIRRAPHILHTFH
jgi:hypothetical protein